MLIDMIAEITLWLCYRQEVVASLPSTLNQVLTHFDLPFSIDRMPMDCGVVLSATSVMGVSINSRMSTFGRTKYTFQHGAHPTENAGVGAYGHPEAAEFTVDLSYGDQPSATNGTEIEGFETAVSARTNKFISAAPM